MTDKYLSIYIYIYPKIPSPIKTKGFNITPFVKIGFVRHLARDDASDLSFLPGICRSSPVDVQPSPCHRIEPGLVAKQQLSNIMKKNRRYDKKLNNCQEK